jgi:hypothetical protein
MIKRSAGYQIRNNLASGSTVFGGHTSGGLVALGDSLCPAGV